MPQTSNFSILVDVELDTSKIQKQLNQTTSKSKVKLDTDDVKNASKDFDSLSDSVKGTELSFQAANEVLSTTIDIIGAMVEQVFTFDSALTEFKKVTDLSGQALNDYTDKLFVMGQAVGRTGKPKVSGPEYTDSKRVLITTRKPVHPKAYSTTIV